MSMVYNFAGITDSAAGIHAAVGITQGLLDEGQASLAKLGGAWGGGGQDAYHAEQTKWNQNAAELMSALQQLAQAVDAAGQTMLQTEHHVTGMFPG